MLQYPPASVKMAFESVITVPVKSASGKHTAKTCQAEPAPIIFASVAELVKTWLLPLKSGTVSPLTVADAGALDAVKLYPLPLLSVHDVPLHPLGWSHSFRLDDVKSEGDQLGGGVEVLSTSFSSTP